MCLLGLAAFYLLLAAYWAQVFPKGNGKPQKCLFFLSPSYWFESNASEHLVTVTDDIQEEDPTSSRRQSMPRGGGIVVDSVRKVYGNDEALKGVSLKMNRGEVTALLGRLEDHRFYRECLVGARNLTVLSCFLSSITGHNGAGYVHPSLIPFPSGAPPTQTYSTFHLFILRTGNHTGKQPCRTFCAVRLLPRMVISLCLDIP
jgi:hypothetical protein